MRDGGTYAIHAVTPPAHGLAVEATRPTIDFTLSQAAAGCDVQIRLRRVAQRWVADVRGARSGTGMGRSASQALVAALEPMGDAATRALLADLGLLEPSIAVLTVEAAASRTA